MERQLLFGFGEPRARQSYQDYLRSPWFKRIADWSKLRDGDKCIWCGRTRKLNSHHVTYENIFHETAEDLETLCIECHKDEHIRKLSRDTYRRAFLESTSPPREDPSKTFIVCA